MLSIEKNEMGVSAAKVKIVLGLFKIREESETAKKHLSDEGAHSTIYLNLFRYSVIDTINKETVNLDPEQWKSKVKDAKG